MTLRTLASRVLPVMVLLLVVPFVLFAVPQLAGADESFVVLSGSMEPTLSAGDAVLVRSILPGSVGVGDVITFERGEGPTTTHRVVAVHPEGFETKGDANEDVDAGLVPRTALVGKVVLVIPLLGYAIRFAGTPAGIVALVVLPLALLAATEVGTVSRGLGRLREPEPIPAITRVEPEASVGIPVGEPTYTLPGGDLALTGATLVVLAAYSGWTLYGEWTRLGRPDSLSMAVFVGSLTALVLVAYTLVSARFADRAATTDEAAVGGER